MGVVAFEGVVEQGQIRLADDTRLPDNMRVVVVVPDAQAQGVARVIRPRLVRPAQAKDFAMDVEELGDPGR